MKSVSYRLIVLGLCLGLAHTLSAQVRTGHSTVKGIVTDANSGSALPSVNVFLRGTTIGTTSQVDGKFVMSDVPGGEYDIVFSLIGYEKEVRHVSLLDSAQFEVNVLLKSKDITVSQIEVTGSAEEWKKLLPFFSREFLGNSDNARECRIVNPEVVSLSIGSSGDSLRAHTDTTLIVENDALGYKIYIQIDDFLFVSKKGWFELRCYPRFVEMTPKDEDQGIEWKKRRAKCYDYSFTHFLNSVLQRRIRESEFLLSTGSLRELQRGKGDDLEAKTISIVPLAHGTMCQINFSSGQIRVDRLDQYASWKSPLGAVEPLRKYEAKESGYDFTGMGGISTKRKDLDTGEPIAVGSSIVIIKDTSVLVDRYGNLARPLSVGFRGFWATRRLADTLPFDYQPQPEAE